MKQFLFLEGHWHLTRLVTPAGKLVGTASFYKEAGVIKYLEQGKWLTPYPELEFSNQLIYQLSSEGLIVYKGETLLHSLVFTANRLNFEASHLHNCGQDQYRTRYIFSSNEYFEIHYQVSGPNKNYLTRSIFQKINNIM
jgi:hypothetical protein